MDWLHCNLCFFQLSSESDLQKFAVTNCGHIFCHTCAGKLTGKCFECHNECRVMPISREMDPGIRTYFRAGTEYAQQLTALQKQATGLLLEFAKAQGYQECQRRHLLDHLNRKGQSSAPRSLLSNEEIQTLQQRNSTDSQTIISLQNELDRLKQVIANSLQQRPGSSARKHANENSSPTGSMVSLAASNITMLSNSSGTQKPFHGSATGLSGVSLATVTRYDPARRPTPVSSSAFSFVGKSAPSATARPSMLSSTSRPSSMIVDRSRESSVASRPVGASASFVGVDPRKEKPHLGSSGQPSSFLRMTASGTCKPVGYRTLASSTSTSNSSGPRVAPSRPLSSLLTSSSKWP